MMAVAVVSTFLAVLLTGVAVAAWSHRSGLAAEVAVNLAHIEQVHGFAADDGADAELLHTHDHHLAAAGHHRAPFEAHDHEKGRAR